jgi:hypothetical protein
VRQVRGVLFLDYVKMVKSWKGGNIGEHLGEDEKRHLAMKIEADGWYPMAVFEKLGVAILKTVARGEMFPVQLWGRYSAQQLHKAYPALLEPGQPVETLRRFHVLRQTFFDFEAITVPSIYDGEAQIAINYFMGDLAEEAASWQALGFFEGLLEIAGAKDIRGDFRAKAWRGDNRSLLSVRWADPTGH